jgi:hypothetical protein
MADTISLYRRNPGHWDVTDGTHRVFAIRGGPHDDSADFWVRDERAGPAPSMGPFATLDAAVSWATSTLMTESN